MRNRNNCDIFLMGSLRELSACVQLVFNNSNNFIPVFLCLLVLDTVLNYKEIELIIKNFPKKKSLGPDSFVEQFYQMFKDLTLVLHNLFQKIEEEEICSN